MSMDDKEISRCREAFQAAGYWPNEVMWEAWKRAWLGGMKSAILAGCQPSAAAPSETGDRNAVIEECVRACEWSWTHSAWNYKATIARIRALKGESKPDTRADRAMSQALNEGDGSYKP